MKHGGPREPGAELAELLLGVTMLLMKRLAARMRQSDQHLEPSHVGLLAKIGEAPCRMSDLAEHQCVQRPTISRSVNVLVERGLVERQIPESNRRTTMVSLTRKGRKVLNKLMEDARLHTEALLAGLNDEQRQLARAALGVLSRTLSPGPADRDAGEESMPHLKAVKSG